MNIFQKDNLKKDMTCSIDADYRIKAPSVPIQPIFSYRTERGSDTSRPERGRQVLDRPSRIAGNPTVEPSKANYWMTGGTKKMHRED